MILSFGAFSLISRASDNAVPKTPMMQADKGSDEKPATPASEKDKESAKKSEEKPKDESTDKKKDESGASASSSEGASSKKHDEKKSHKDQTPSDLDGLGIYYKDDEGSQVADKTKKILEVNLPKAMQRKNDAAREFLTVNAEGRADPLYVTDLIPDALRPELEGEGISGAIDKGLLDQLIETQLTTFFKYVPIQIAGTMQNGVNKIVFLRIPSLGITKAIPLSEGQGFSFPLGPAQKGVYFINITIAYVSEDNVTLNLSASVYDRFNRRLIASTPTVQRHFYVRRYQ